MLDGKILTAVLASLAAIGTAMNGGHIDSSDLQSVRENPLSTNFDSFMPGSLGAFTEYMKNPEPDTNIDAELKIDDMAGQTLKLSSASLRSNNLTKIKTGKRRITSETELTFHSFTGRLDLGDPTDIKGNAEYVLSNGVNISGGFEVEEEVSTDKISLIDVERSKINLKDVSGSINSDSASTEFGENISELKINSFSGNITISPDDRRIKLSGKVDKLDAGKISLD